MARKKYKRTSYLIGRDTYTHTDPHEALKQGVRSKESEWLDWIDSNNIPVGKSDYVVWLKKAYPIKSKSKSKSKSKPKPKKTPKSKAHMYPPPKTKKSLRPTSAQINSYFDKKEKKQTPRGTKPLLKPFDAAVKKRLEREKKLADSSAKISSRRVQSPSLKAELAKKENAKKIASQRKNLKIQQDKKKIRNLRQMGNL